MRGLFCVLAHPLVENGRRIQLLLRLHSNHALEAEPGDLRVPKGLRKDMTKVQDSMPGVTVVNWLSDSHTSGIATPTGAKTESSSMSIQISLAFFTGHTELWCRKGTWSWSVICCACIPPSPLYSGSSKSGHLPWTSQHSQNQHVNYHLQLHIQPRKGQK